MDNNDQKSNVNLNELWLTLRKIRTAVLRHGINMIVEFAQNDPKNYGLITGSFADRYLNICVKFHRLCDSLCRGKDTTFSSILGKYEKIIGLSDFEIREVLEYFRDPDGRIAYNQFCEFICEEGQDSNLDQMRRCGEERTDPMHVNPITDEEKRLLCILLVKIARTSPIPLLPYFQDYELVTRNCGSVTVAHFSRVLHFMKLHLTQKDLMLLLKRYMKDSYTVNYIAFLKHIDAIMMYLKGKGLMESNINLDVEGFPGHLIDLTFPDTPFLNVNGINKPTESSELHTKPKDVSDVIYRIQRYVYENRIRVSEFIESFDLLNLGSITKNQLLRALDNVEISSSKRLKLSQKDLEMIFARYADPFDKDRVQWKVFVDEIDKVFTEKNLDKQPQLTVQSPPEHIKTLKKPGQKNWQEVSSFIRDLCEETVARIQNKIKIRQIYLHPFFKSFDRLNQGYVRPKQAFQAFLGNTILISEEEFAALEARYSNDVGFNYMRFLEDVDPVEYAFPKLKEPLPLREVSQADKPSVIKKKPTEQNIINSLSKAKRQAAVNNVQLIDFFRDYDRHRENQITESEFRRGLDNANVKLAVPDVDIICDMFRSSNSGCSIRYRDFCNALEEIFIQENTSQDNKLSAPLKHFPCADCGQCFLNFEERTIASKALQKLARRPDQISNLQSLFKDFDRENCGTVTQNQFLRALTVRDMNNMISSHEFEVVCKCFGYERGLQIEFDYRSFLDILNILHETGQVRRHF